MKNKNNSNTMEVTLGSDPELFLFDTEQDKIVSSIPVLKHDKYDPIDLGDGIKMYADNVLVEFSFPPAKNKKEIVERFKSVFSRAQEKLGSRYRLVAKASHTYDKDELSDKKAWEAGCDPNFNAHDSCMNPPAEFKSGLRSGSFHVHIGNENLTSFHARENAIKLLDVIVGTASTIFDRDETSAARRELYGKAGEFRPTDYGIEYRVLGNFALRSPETTELVFDLIEHTLSQIKAGKEVAILKSLDMNKVREAINTNNSKLSEEILVEAGLPNNLLARVKKDYVVDFYKSWGIKVD